MKHNPQKHHRRSIRLKGYDYSQAGWYYITICANNREMMFGDVENGKMILNDAGKMIKILWQEIPKYYSGIEIDVIQIMPNHMHGIINIVGTDPCVCPGDEQNNIIVQLQGTTETTGQLQGIAPKISLPNVVQRFKSLSTTQYIEGVKQKSWKPFDGKIWQRNYFERVIRDEPELNRIRKYIIENPLKWQDDKYNP